MAKKNWDKDGFGLLSAQEELNCSFLNERKTKQNILHTLLQRVHWTSFWVLRQARVIWIVPEMPWICPWCWCCPWRSTQGSWRGVLGARRTATRLRLLWELGDVPHQGQTCCQLPRWAPLGSRIFGHGFPKRTNIFLNKNCFVQLSKTFDYCVNSRIQFTTKPYIWI